MSYKRARIQGNDNGPAFLDSHGAPSGVRYQVEITVLQDDVTTVAFIANKQTGDQLAVGYAKRHKADARNPEVGKDLALARAFKDLGQRYATKAERGLHPDPDPMREPLRALRRANRAEQKKRKNEKRREARRAWYAKQEAETLGETSFESESDWRGRVFGDWE